MNVTFALGVAVLVLMSFGGGFLFAVLLIAEAQRGLMRGGGRW